MVESVLSMFAVQGLLYMYLCGFSTTSVFVFSVLGGLQLAAHIVDGFSKGCANSKNIDWGKCCLSFGLQLCSSRLNYAQRLQCFKSLPGV